MRRIKRSNGNAAIWERSGPWVNNSRNSTSTHSCWRRDTQESGQIKNLLNFNTSEKGETRTCGQAKTMTYTIQTTAHVLLKSVNDRIKNKKLINKQIQIIACLFQCISIDYHLFCLLFYMVDLFICLPVYLFGCLFHTVDFLLLFQFLYLFLDSFDVINLYKKKNLNTFFHINKHAAWLHKLNYKW